MCNRKKSNEARFDEIREYMREPILATLKENCSSWLMDNKLCLFIIAIVERFGGRTKNNVNSGNILNSSMY